VSYKNPEPGTVVDREITTGRDFYLISQKTLQGTASPTHYFILAYYSKTEAGYIDAIPNETVIKKIELLTYRLSYLYYNWTGSIKVPSPIQYA